MSRTNAPESRQKTVAVASALRPGGAVVAQGGAANWIEPFAAPYRLIRILSALLVTSVVALLLLGYWNLHLTQRATAMVYMIDPRGEATVITDRAANIAPSPIEAQAVARRFVQLMYGWNSSTILHDLAALVDLCSPELAAQYRQELAEVGFLDTIRERRIRTEVHIDSSDTIVSGPENGHFQVSVRGEAHIFPLDTYDGGQPLERRAFDVLLSLSAVPRSAERRPNGLEVSRLIQGPGRDP